MKLKFTKMHGAGNDYIYVNTAECPVEEPQRLSILLSKPHYGIGSDGLVLIGKSEKADFSMRIFNADGSEAKMCGNASRCVGKYVYERGLTDKTAVELETLSGIKILNLHVGPDSRTVNKVTVDMGEPAGIEEVDLTEYGFPAGGVKVSMGNPHLVVWTDDVEAVPLTEIGPVLERHPLFPDRVNVEFAQRIAVAPGEAGAPEEIAVAKVRMRVWERGSGITLACGTGACATAVAAAYSARAGRKCEIVMDGGTLEIEWDQVSGHVFMTGPAAEVFEGTVEID